LEIRRFVIVQLERQPRVYKVFKNVESETELVLQQPTLPN